VVSAIRQLVRQPARFRRCSWVYADLRETLGPAGTRHPRTPTDPLPESGGQVVAGSNPVSPTAEMSSELREWTCRPPSPAVCGRQPRSAAHEQYMSSYPLMPERPSALGGYRGSQRRRSDPCSGRGNRHNKRGQPLRGAVRRGPNSSVTRTVATYLVPSAWARINAT